MKKVTYLLMISLGLSLFSCESNLDEVPLSFLEESNSFNSAEDANSAIGAVYHRLRGIYGMNMINMGDLTADDLEVRPENGLASEIDKLLFNSAHPWFNSFYTNSYILIDRANRVIENVPNIAMEDEEKQRIIAEAKFLRALAYFNLVRSFGDVPLVISVTDDITNVQIERTDSEEVYEFIIKDLIEAEVNLPLSYSEENMVGRATKGAAKAILSKVYLTVGQWENAAKKSKEVIDLGIYDLFPSYEDVFQPENRNGREHIFSVQYSCILSEYGSSMAINFAIYFTYPINLGGGSYQVTPEYADSFLQGDSREGVAVIYEKELADGTIVESRTGPHTDKYWDPMPCGSSSARNNFMVIRYADVLLMYAEALNELGGPNQEAYQAINKVRQRARTGNDSQLVDLEGLNQAEFRDAVLQERSWELAFEGHRRWALLRTGTYIEKMNASGIPAEEKHLLYPIPINQMDINLALTQNPGY